MVHNIIDSPVDTTFKKASVDFKAFVDYRKMKKMPCGLATLPK